MGLKYVSERPECPITWETNQSATKNSDQNKRFDIYFNRHGIDFSHDKLNTVCVMNIKLHPLCPLAECE